MDKQKLFLLVGIALSFSACAIPTRQTDSFLMQTRDIPEVSAIKGVPFVLQEKNHCGPASLAMIMAFAGRPIAVDTLASQVFTPGRKGTLQSDLISAVRRNGMVPIEVRGVSALLHEIAAGHPVLIFENLGLSWYSYWHYAVAFGYDLGEPALTLHSGSKQGSRIDLRKFERSWKDSDYWGLVVLQPGDLAASADDLTHIAAAAGLEQLGETRQARLVYMRVLKKWPESLGALIGMGNIQYSTHDYRGSAGFLQHAVRVNPDSSVAWHNLATAQGAAHQLKQARLSVAKAMSLANAADVEKYRQSLHEWLAIGPLP